MKGKMTDENSEECSRDQKERQKKVRESKKRENAEERAGGGKVRKSKDRVKEKKGKQNVIISINCLTCLTMNDTSSFSTDGVCVCVYAGLCVC